MNHYFAHISEDGRQQTVEEHLKGTAKLAAEFATEFNAGEYGYLAGIAHDIGKYSEAFQLRLAGGPRVDHSTAGALECSAIGQELVGLCIAGHHGGIPDFGNMLADQPGDDTFIGRIKKYMSVRESAYSGWTDKLPVTPPIPFFSGEEFARSFWIRMIYSCLVDADFLDTEAFMNGGKTVSSLSFALEHAKKYGMKRIIYVIPYTSIIEQNAEVFRVILGDENVIEHHSEADYSYGEELTDLQKRAALAAENWDAPIIVTTAVQFFESVYANKPSKCRKLHNIVNSVIVFDEVQSIPAYPTAEQAVNAMAALYKYGQLKNRK